MPFNLRRVFQPRANPRVAAQPQQPAIAIPPGDVPKPLAPGLTVQPEEIRDLRELIRRRYELDIEIWSLRHVKPRDRPIVEDKMRRSDAALQKILRTICAWENPNAFRSRNDWEKLQDIKVRMEEGGKRVWAIDPPWDDQTVMDRTIRI